MIPAVLLEDTVTRRVIIHSTDLIDRPENAVLVKYEIISSLKKTQLSTSLELGIVQRENVVRSGQSKICNRKCIFEDSEKVNH